MTLPRYDKSFNQNLVGKTVNVNGTVCKLTGRIKSRTKGNEYDAGLGNGFTITAKRNMIWWLVDKFPIHETWVPSDNCKFVSNDGE